MHIFIMNLNLNYWSPSDGQNLIEYLNGFSKGKKGIEFEEKLFKSNYPCIAEEIFNGNYLSFLDLNLNDNASLILLNGKIISKIKDFNLQKEYLLKYLTNVDCWATTDVLKFKPTPKTQQNYFELALYLLKSKNTFYRRTAVIILFAFKKNDNYSTKICNLISNLKNESEYYVNMAVAWFLQEWFLYNKNGVLSLLKSGNLNEFVIRKTISKCHDSFRVSVEDKKLLKQILKNNG